MIQIILIALISAAIQFVLPWWSLAVVAFAVCFWQGISKGKAFTYGLVGAALPWLVYALFIHTNTGGILTERMGKLLFGSASSIPVILVTTILGGLVGGLASLSGYLVRQAIGHQSAKLDS